jgi:hypothetical protein
MSTSFYPGLDEDIVPWNARYTYPGKNSKAVKVTPKIQPYSGSTFNPGQTIKLNFPNQGYCNPTNTTIQFDVTLFGAKVTTAGVDTYNVTGSGQLRFQNNIQCLFKRVRILYGSTPLEDIIDYNQIVRNLTEWSGSNQNNTIDQNSIANGIGGNMYTQHYGGSEKYTNIRQKYIQGLYGQVVDGGIFEMGSCPNSVGGVSSLSNEVGTWACTRTYQVNLNGSGLFSQDKLIPLKFMASQLSIEITLEAPEGCIFQRTDFALNGTASGSGGAPSFASPVVPTYSISNITLIPEILEFDSNYDSMFLLGLKEEGVPLKFASWHTFKYTLTGSSSCRLQINENAKSLKAMFCCQTVTPTRINYDSQSTINSSGTSGFMTNYQYKVGDKYFPPSPVRGSFNNASNRSNCGVEAFIELQKALNVLGKLNISSAVNSIRWASKCSNPVELTKDFEKFNEYIEPNGDAYLANSTFPFCGDVGSACYCAAINLETTNGAEISGINSQELGEIAFIGQWSVNQTAGYTLTVFTYFDAMLIFRENNLVELVQ